MRNRFLRAGAVALAAAAALPLFGNVAQASPATPAGLPGYTTKVWSEEFTGTTAPINTAEWYVADGVTNNLVTSKASNVRIANGVLETRLMDTDGDKQPNTGAHLYTTKQMLDVGEVVEFRARFAGSKQVTTGNKHRSWAAVWTAGSPWAAPGELDIAEVLSGKPTTNYHYGTYPNVTPVNGPAPTAVPTKDVWQTYSVERTPTQYIVRWGGVVVHTFAEKDNGGPQNLMITAGNGSDDEFDWAGSPLQVDSVAVYRKP